MALLAQPLGHDDVSLDDLLGTGLSYTRALPSLGSGAERHRTVGAMKPDIKPPSCFARLPIAYPALQRRSKPDN